MEYSMNMLQWTWKPTTAFFSVVLTLRTRYQKRWNLPPKYPHWQKLQNLFQTISRIYLSESRVNLDEEQSVKLAQFLIEFADVFAKDDTDLGCFSATQHCINTGDSKPIQQQMHQTPLGVAEEE